MAPIVPAATPPAIQRPRLGWTRPANREIPATRKPGGIDDRMVEKTAGLLQILRKFVHRNVRALDHRPHVRERLDRTRVDYARHALVSGRLSHLRLTGHRHGVHRHLAVFRVRLQFELIRQQPAQHLHNHRARGWLRSRPAADGSAVTRTRQLGGHVP